jgi:sugar-phosphatase
VSSRLQEEAPAWLGEVRAILFDLDGTLVDSDAAVERAWRTYAEEYGGGECLEAVGMHGRPAEQTVRRLDPELDEDAVRERAQRQLSLQYDDPEPLQRCPGATELLELIGRLGMAWAVVTSGDDRLARTRLDRTGIEPPLLITADDVTEGKPAPEGYLRAAKQLGIPIERCLVVEDSEPGLTAGRRAGARTAALRGLAGDLRVADLGVLSRLLAAA